MKLRVVGVVPTLPTVRLVAKLATGAAAPVISIEEVRGTQVEGGDRAGHRGLLHMYQARRRSARERQAPGIQLGVVVKPHRAQLSAAKQASESPCDGA